MSTRVALIVLAGVAALGLVTSSAGARRETLKGLIAYEKCMVPSRSHFCGSDIWVMRADGSHQRKLNLGRTSSDQDHAPVWSPDGKKIAFWREPKWLPDRDTIFITNADGTHVTRLARGNSPSWSPDGRSLVFQGPHGLYVVGADGGTVRKLAARGGMPDWSPDGERVVFSYSRPRGRSSLHVINIDGTHERVLARGEAWNPKWSPNGDAIVYANWGGGWMLNVRSGHRTHLGNFPYGADLSWSPDGNQIIWDQAADWPNAELWVMNRDGSERQRLTHTRLAEYAPDWTD
ncbi:MAG TPA: hypothetical protein VFU30_10115 [Gaiellaceae bacterium]|nr:hypothetical protein [Gaiellaceae bacterium]